MTNTLHGFSVDSREVWCDFREAEALTRIHADVHFCQFCGATDHEELTPARWSHEGPSAE